MSREKKDRMSKIVSLAKRRGFVYPGSEIYGGLSNAWDFGPLGAQLKKNIKDLWWEYFVVKRDDIIGIDGALMMNPKVWKASGHLAGFNDALVDCRGCQARIRADHLVEDQLGVKVEGKTLDEISQIIKDKGLKCPECGQTDLTPARQFNLMFKTHIGTVEDETSTVYLRPETAQTSFTDFKNILDSTRIQLPFGIAQQGKAFRNEITPGNFIFRVLEFEQMEIEYFIREQEWEQVFEKWQSTMSDWLEYIGLKRDSWVIREHAKEELSHYSKKTIDFEYKFPFGTKELYGLAYRTNFDLTNHTKHSGEKLEYHDPKTNEKFIPHVIEPTFGVERTFLTVLCDAYEEVEGGRGDDSRQAQEVVLRLHPRLAPVKVAVFPLMKKAELTSKAREIVAKLRNELGYLPNFVIAYDESGSIGKRYRRQDEIGTPYCVTIDFDSLEDGAVTVRDRDSMKQERVGIGELGEVMRRVFVSA